MWRVKEWCLHIHPLCQLGRTVSLLLLIIVIVIIIIDSRPAKVIKPENGVLLNCTQSSGTGIQPDLFHLQMDTMAPARLLRKKTSERRQTPERGRRRIKSQLRLRLC